MVEAKKPMWLGVPGWREAFPWLRAGFSMRMGGVSEAYGRNELNLGWTAEDEDAAVAENRRRFLEAVSGRVGMPLVTVRQVHGSHVVDVDGVEEPMTPEGRARVEGDGLMSRRPGAMLGVVTADCTPVLVVDPEGRGVAAFHAGWRGTVAGIVRDGLTQMGMRWGSATGELRAAIGPAIRPCCFEVGPEVVAAFREAFGGAAESWIVEVGGGKARVDLQAANRWWMERAGVPAEAIVTVTECSACGRTAAGERRFFSHRAEVGRTGRMLHVIGMVE